MKDRIEKTCWEDRENDWLAKEMRREGYYNNTSGLERAHQQEEASRGWDAGAISNAQEHEEIHNLINMITSTKQQTVKQQMVSKVLGEALFFIILALFIIIFIRSILLMWRF